MKIPVSDPVIDFIRDRFDNLEGSMKDGFKEVNTNFADHNTRITTLESATVYSKGKVAAYSAIGGGLMTLAGIGIEAWIIK